MLHGVYLGIMIKLLPRRWKCITKIFNLLYNGDSTQFLKVFQTSWALQYLRLIFVDFEIELFQCFHCSDNLFGVFFRSNTNNHIVSEAENLLGVNKFFKVGIELRASWRYTFNREGEQTPPWGDPLFAVKVFSPQLITVTHITLLLHNNDYCYA